MGYTVTILYLQSFLVYPKYHVAYSIENLKQILMNFSCHVHLHPCFLFPITSFQF